MGFVSSLLGFANKVGGIANKFVNNSGLIGKIAQGVSKAANLVSTIVPKAMPIVNKVMTVANLAYKSGLADKLTGGKATRFVKGVQNMFGGLLLLLCSAALRAAHFMHALRFAQSLPCSCAAHLRPLALACLPSLGSLIKMRPEG